MSDQLAIDILKIVMPAVTAYMAWMQFQINKNRNDLMELLKECLKEKNEEPKNVTGKK